MLNSYDGVLRESLENYNFVLLKDNATKRPLQSAYSCVYNVAKRTEKEFTVVINNKQ